MNTLKITILVVAVAGIAIGSGCGTGDYRADWAQSRCERVMAQARMEAVHELLAAGHIDQAQKVLQQYLPGAADQTAPHRLLAAEEDEDDKEKTPSQYAKATLEHDLDPEAQAW